MSATLRIALLIGILVYIFFIFVMLKKKNIDLKYSLIWFFSAFVLLILDAFPKLVEKCAGLLGIATASNFIYLVVLFFILLVLISLTSIVSRQKRDIRTLIQTVSILKKRVEELENEK